MRHQSLSNFCDPQWDHICYNKWHQEISGISIPLEIISWTYFHARHGSKTTMLVAISKSGFLTIRQPMCSATSKHLSLYPQGDSSGLRKPNKKKKKERIGKSSVEGRQPKLKRGIFSLWSKSYPAGHQPSVS